MPESDFKEWCLFLIAISYCQEGTGDWGSVSPYPLQQNHRLSAGRSSPLVQKCLHRAYPCLYTWVMGSSLPIRPLPSLGGPFWGKFCLRSSCTL